MLPVEVTPRLHSHFALAGLHRNGGRNQIGMLAGFTPEQCPVSCRNGGRNDPEYAAREAIRGTTAIVDGLRGAYALWPTPDKDAKGIASSLGKSWLSNLVVSGAIVKANSAESKHVATFVRNEIGLLEDCTNHIKHGDNVSLRKKLCDAFRGACLTNNRFFKSGKKGVYERRDELPIEVQGWGRDKLKDFVQQMDDDGMIVIDPKVGIYVM
jgi:hypothetical protein